MSFFQFNNGGVQLLSRNEGSLLGQNQDLCPQYYSSDAEQLVNALMEDNLPPHLQEARPGGHFLLLGLGPFCVTILAGVGVQEAFRVLDG